MAIRFPSLPKLSGRAIAILAALGALAVGVVAAKSHPSTPPADTPAAAPASKPPSKPASTTAADTKAAASLPQCRAAQLVPVNRSWGVPVPSMYGSASTNCNLMYGDNPNRASTVYGDPDTAIRVLQRNLNFCYGTKLAVDGIYGNKTRAAVKLVQSRHNLTPDGIYGPKTRSAMNWRLYSMATRSWSKGCSSPI